MLFLFIFFLFFLKKSYNLFKKIYIIWDQSRNLSKIVSVLLSASVDRFFVSRMQDFFDDFP